MRNSVSGQKKDAREEFEAAALPFLPELYRTAAGLLGNRDEAEDLVQDVFLQAWKSWHRFEPGTNIRAWLHKIMVYRGYHFRRKFFRLRPFGNRENASEDIPVEEIPVETPVPDYLSNRQVMEALSKVPAPFRETLVLADVREFSYQEIASMLGIPIGTVMSRLSRGRKSMRENLSSLQ
jgi:RNA polymerase sigma-70 factor, ECF subfamily